MWLVSPQDLPEINEVHGTSTGSDTRFVPADSTEFKMPIKQDVAP